MKQGKTILLCVIMIALSTACGKRNLESASPMAQESAQQSQSTPAEVTLPQESSSADSQLEENLAENYAAILRNGNYYIDCTAVIEVQGMQLENPMLIAVAGENSSISISSDLSGVRTTLRTLTYEGNIYQVNDAQRSYRQIDPSQSMNSFDTDFSQLRYVGEGEELFCGETRLYAAYERGDDQTVRFFFDGKTLLGLTQPIMDDQADEMVLKINGLSPNIPQHLIEMPIGYTKQ